MLCRLLFSVCLLLSISRGYTDSSAPTTALAGHGPRDNVSPLVRRFPSLASLPRFPILKYPTPLANLAQYQAAIGSDQPVLIKRDDLIEPPFQKPTSPLGGNKARKLEYLLPDAQLLQRPHLVCPGEWGSNTAFTAVAAADAMGFGKVKLLLGPQPVTADVKAKLLADFALGADLSYYADSGSMGIALALSYHASAANSSDMYVINPGASSDGSDVPYIGPMLTNPLASSTVGDLGFINAFLELQAQLTGAGLSMPEEIYVAAGSLGTSSALMVGACIAQAATTIVAVQAATPIVCNLQELQSKAARLYTFLQSRLDDADKATLPKCNFSNGVRWVADYFPPDYGAPHPGELDVMTTLWQLEQVQLDVTYTGKAFQALHDRLTTAISQHQPVPRTLFWQTYNAYDLNQIIQQYPWTNASAPWLDLPQDFHHLFDSVVASA